MHGCGILHAWYRCACVTRTQASGRGQVPPHVTTQTGSRKSNHRGNPTTTAICTDPITISEANMCTRNRPAQLAAQMCKHKPPTQQTPYPNIPYTTHADNNQTPRRPDGCPTSANTPAHKSKNLRNPVASTQRSFTPAGTTPAGTPCLGLELGGRGVQTGRPRRHPPRVA